MPAMLLDMLSTGERRLETAMNNSALELGERIRALDRRLCELLRAIVRDKRHEDIQEAKETLRSIELCNIRLRQSQQK